MNRQAPDMQTENRVTASGIDRWLRALLASAIVFLSTPTQAQEAPDTAVVADPDETEQELAKSSPDALVAYSDAASYQNNGAFELAAEAWEEFLKAHGDDPKALDATYNLGVSQLQLKQFEKAAATLKKVIEADKDYSRIEDAYLNAGWALYSAALNEKPELFKEANGYFTKLVNDFPKGSYRDQALFFQGESFYMQGQREEAAKAYKTLVDEFDESKMLSDAMYALGVTYEELGQFDESGKVYDKFVSSFSDSQLVNEVRMRRAETVLRLGDAKDAEKRFAEVAAEKDFASADHATYRQAFCVAEQERYEDAAILFAKIPTDFPESRYVDQATMATGRSYFRANKLDEAASWFDKVIAANNAFKAEAIHWRARLFISAKNPEKALSLIEGHSDIPTDNGFYVNLMMDHADALYEIADRKKDAYAEYVAIAKDYADHILAPHALYNAAFAAMELKQPAIGLQLTKRFLETYADHKLVPDVKHVAAECSLQTGDNSSAVELFADVNKANADNPDNPVAIRQALAMYLKKDYTGAISTLSGKATEFTNPAHVAEAHYILGVSYLGQNEPEKAIGELEASLAVKTEFAQADEAMLSLSRAQRKLNKTDEAIVTIRRVIAEYPASPNIDKAYYRLGEYSYQNGDYSTSIEAYSHVISSASQDSLIPYSLYGRGWAQLRALKLEDAGVSFSQLLNDYSDHKLARQALYARAMSYQQNRDFENGLKDASEYLDGESSDTERADALYVKGLCEAGLEQTENAARTFTSILKDKPDYSGADKVLYELGWAYKNLDRKDDSVAVFKRLAAQHPTSELAAEALYHSAEHSYDGGEYETAVVSYTKASALVGENEELGEKILYKLGWAQYQSGKYDEAREAFAKQAANYPDRKLANDATFMEAECYFKQKKYSDAFTVFERIKGKPVSTDQIQVLTLLHGGQCASQMKEWATCINWLNEITRNHADTPYLPTVMYEQAWALQNAGKLNDAIKVYTDVTKRSRGEVGARARFMIGEILYANRQYNNAIKEFQKVMFGYGAEKASENVKRWQAKAGFEAGQCAGVLASGQNDPNTRSRYVGAAKQFFEYVVAKHPDAKEANAAREQLQKY
ncbi:MAG: tetratricopeptide repeat protein [Planctomycetales bacterium]|nr:tetratricopeptide repeat protein [Planctomycetales bacterium]